MKKITLFLLVICILMAGCSGAPDDTEATSAMTETTMPVQEETEAPTEIVEETEAATPVIQPLPETLDIEHLTNCTVAISLEEGAVFADESGIIRMYVTVYTYDLYDMVDIATLQPGSTIVIGQENVSVESVEESGNFVQINGGLDLGGYELTTNENGVYFEIGYSDVKSWHAIGETTLPVSEGFIYTDSSDLDAEPVQYAAEDLLAAQSEIGYGFTPHNTTIVIEGGSVTAMNRIYTP